MRTKNSERHCRNFKAALLCAIALFSLISCSAFESPSITDSYPSETTGFTGVRPNIYISFSKEMNKEVTQNAFSLTSEAPVPSGTFSWSGNTMQYQLASDLEYGARYTIKITTSAEASDKSKLGVTFVAHFYAGSDLTTTNIVSTSPTNLNMNVPLTSTIDITFSRPMSVTDTEAAFQLSPAVTGLFSWSNGNTVLTYTPFQGFTFNQQYTVTIAKTAKDARGMPLVSDYVFYFKAGANFVKPQLVSAATTGGVTITSGVTNVEKNDGFVITFDKAMDYSVTQGAFSIIDGDYGNVVPGSYSWLASFSGFTFQPTDFLVPQRKYYLQVTQSAKDSVGNNLQSQVYYDFTVNGPNSQYLTINQIALDPSCTALYVNASGNTVFDITTADLVNQLIFSTSPGWNCSIKITFSAAMTVESVPDNISITRILGNDTSLVGAITALTWDATKTILTLNLGSLGDNVYQIKAIGTNTGILDQNKNYLKSDFVILFRSHQ